MENDALLRCFGKDLVCFLNRYHHQNHSNGSGVKFFWKLKPTQREWNDFVRMFSFRCWWMIQFSIVLMALTAVDKVDANLNFLPMSSHCRFILNDVNHHHHKKEPQTMKRSATEFDYRREPYHSSNHENELNGLKDAQLPVTESSYHHQHHHSHLRRTSKSSKLSTLSLNFKSKPDSTEKTTENSIVSSSPETSMSLNELLSSSSLLLHHSGPLSHPVHHTNHHHQYHASSNRQTRDINGNNKGIIGEKLLPDLPLQPSTVLPIIQSSDYQEPVPLNLVDPINNAKFVDIDTPNIEYNHFTYFPPSDSHPVFIGLEIIDVDQINDAENFFSLQMHLFELWHEPRLNTTALKQIWSKNEGDAIPVHEANIADCLWTPSLIFEDSTEKDKILPPTTILLVNKNRVLLRKSRYSLKVRCHMNLQIYPMDKHSCHFKLRTCESPTVQIVDNFFFQTVTDSTNKVLLKWLSDSGSPMPDLLDQNQNRCVTFSEEFTPSLFDIRVGRQSTNEHVWLNEPYSMLDVEFIFERRIIHSLLTVYIPSSLIVTLSWLQFWFDVEAVPGRMSLGIMSTLTIMTQILTNYEKAGNHVTAVDIWLFVCLIMVFLALMEYALAYTISHYYDDDFFSLNSPDDEGKNFSNENQQQNKQQVMGPSKQPLLNAWSNDANANDRLQKTSILKNDYENLHKLMRLLVQNHQAAAVRNAQKKSFDQSKNPVYDLENDLKDELDHFIKPSDDDEQQEEEDSFIKKLENSEDVSEKILMAQLRLLKVTKELDSLIKEKYFDVFETIESMRLCNLEAQRSINTAILLQDLATNTMATTNQTNIDEINNNNTQQLQQRKSQLNACSKRHLGEHEHRAGKRPQSFHRSLRSKFTYSLRRQMSAATNKGPYGADDGRCRSRLSEVDYCSRYLFPFSFVLFAVIYWIALIYYKLSAS